MLFYHFTLYWAEMNRYQYNVQIHGRPREDAERKIHYQTLAFKINPTF